MFISEEVINAYILFPDLPLFLVRKSHVDSENKNLEWRLSFSVVEKEIIKEIPPIPKRAFMICKELMAFKIFRKFHGSNFESSQLWKSFFLQDNNSAKEVEKISKIIKDEYNPLTTYHWKTALLKKMDDSWGEADRNIGELYEMVRELIGYVLTAVQEKTMSNYFLPGMNLYHKFTDEEFKSCTELLEEMLSDFPETIRTLVFSKNYNVNLGGDERINLLPYQRFDEFRQEINNIPDVLLLEGYYSFLTSMFTSDLKHPSDWFWDSSGRLQQSVKHAYFLKRMAKHLGLYEEDEPDFLVSFNNGFKSLTADFPFIRLIMLAVEKIEGQNILQLLLEFLECPPEGQFLPSQLLVKRFHAAPNVSIMSSISNVFALAKHFGGNNQQKLKAESVMKYIDITGQIKTAKLKDDIRQHFDSQSYYKCCEKIVGRLSNYNFGLEEPQLVSWLQPKNMKECMGLENPNLVITWAQPPLLSDIKCKIFDLLWKILEPILVEENRRWMSIDELERIALLESIKAKN